MLGQALGEIGGVLRSIGIARRDLRVVCCDAQAYEAQTVRDLGQVDARGRRRHRHGPRRRGGGRAAARAGSDPRAHRRLDALAARAAAAARRSWSG